MTYSLPAHADGVHITVEELLPYRQHTSKWLPPAKSLWSQLLGQHQSRQLGRGMDFAEVRQYQPGDDIRAIDWRVTARTGKPHTKLFTEEREKPVILYIDLSSSMQFGSTAMFKAVQAAHMASLLSWLAIAEKDRIGAVIDTGSQVVEIKPTSRQKGPLQIIAQVAQLQEQALTKAGEAAYDSMQQGMLALNRLCPKGSDIVLISDFVRYQDELKPLFNQLHRRNRIRLIHIYDPLEQGQTLFRGTELVSDQKQARWLNFSLNSTRNGIKKAFESHQEKLELLCQSMKMEYHSLSSEGPLLQQLAG
ncbi:MULTISPECIES: DUF58 domain-containing protein [Vibrio]|uniref:DUF58 domain-containing protein n=2 Tax=Vibrio TaxID=662 RepID=A0A7X4LL65_9VIBR|nr:MULTISPECIES: DUF58 domain-containing protein [Vibrio]MBF9002054.1 DUF58 domain-containing protein [Vibrio nitrifigilis]MZI94005.1 DUF58 domain-containing protein [Vibrio eleionomae]